MAKKNLRKSTSTAKPEPAVPVNSVLAEANQIVHGARQQAYGDKLANHAQISMMLTGLLATKLQPDQCITPEDVVQMMLVVKLARLSKSPAHHDSLVDIAGYAAVYGAIKDERAYEMELPGALADYGIDNASK